MMYSTAIFVVVNLAFLSGSFSQEIPSSDALLQKVSEVGNIQGIEGLNTSALPIEEAKTAIKNKCETNGGPLAYNKSENAAKEIETCIRGLVNTTQLTEEIEQAKPTGDLDIVFRRYCNKSPILKGCVRNFTTTVEACFEPKERENIRLIQNITDSLLQFVCFKEGDRIALFISAGGPECLQSKQQVIQDCVNTTFGSHVPAEGFNPASPNGLDNLPLFLLNTKECTNIENLQTCVVRELEKCSDPTPGNIVDSLFNFIKKVTPCENLLSKARAEASVRRDGDASGSSSMIHRTGSAGPRGPGAQLAIIALGYLVMRFV